MSADEELVHLGDLERRARAVMSRADIDYFDGGAEDERTLRANVDAFRHATLWPRVLVDVSSVSTQLALPTLGCPKLEMPIMIAPVAMQRLAHEEGEIAAARACATKETVYCMSQQSTVSVEDVGKASADGCKFFQCYVLSDRPQTLRLIRRAEAIGCKALVITVDAPVLGRRERDVRNGFMLRKGLSLANIDRTMPSVEPPSSSSTASSAAQASIAKRIGGRDRALVWDDVAWLKSQCNLPVVLKGVVTYADAQLAVAAGADGVWVSNHGGRQLDGGPSTLAALPEVVAGVAGRLPVFFDGGVRRGADVLKALALGATAVFVGRPLVWALAVDGQQGVEDMLDMLHEELVTAMALTGCASLAAIQRSHVTLPHEPPPRPHSRL